MYKICDDSIREPMSPANALPREKTAAMVTPARGMDILDLGETCFHFPERGAAQQIRANQTQMPKWDSFQLG